MTTLQKAIVGGMVVILGGALLYQLREASVLRAKVQTLERQQVPAIEQLAQLNLERDSARSELTALRQENERLQAAVADMPRLRGEMATLQVAIAKQGQGDSNDLIEEVDPFSQSIKALSRQAAELNNLLQGMPERKIPEIQFLKEHQWLDAVRDADLQTEVGIRKALAKLRSLAKSSFAGNLSRALDDYIAANQGLLPNELSQLKPYFKVPVEDSILERYEMLHRGSVNDLPPDAWVISEKRPVDRDYDSHYYVAPKGRTGSWGTGLGSSGDPDPNWVSR